MLGFFSILVCLNQINIEVPSLPTDNLYKFLALSGVLIIILFNYLITSVSLKNENELESDKLELKLASHKINSLKESIENSGINTSL